MERERDISLSRRRALNGPERSTRVKAETAAFRQRAVSADTNEAALKDQLGARLFGHRDRAATGRQRTNQSLPTAAPRETAERRICRLSA